MNHRNSNMTLLAMALLVTACGNGTVDQMTGQEGADVATTSPSVTFTPENDGAAMASPSGPIQISYRIIGKPIVGEPLAIDLRIT